MAGPPASRTNLKRRSLVTGETGNLQALHYRQQAARARDLASQANVPSLRSTLEDVAERYDRLADKSEEGRISQS
jgi:hypothetical protein